MAGTVLTPRQADEILLYMRRMPPAEWSVTEQQAEKIKYLWRLLHDFDTEHEYTFNESFTKIRKEKR